jgi:arabinose-5-phosphate isomerase
MEHPTHGENLTPLAPFDHFVHAILEASKACGEALPQAVALLADCRGQVVCTGAGKSGLVARKLVSSLRTQGRRAAWLDPGAAAHGEAGLVVPGDVLVAISRSGESDEVVHLTLGAPCPVVALTARPASRLGRAAQIVLGCGTVSDPDGAPPSASYLAASAVVEALILGLGPAASAHHPAGAIGRASSIPVARVMHPPPVLHPQATMSELLAALTRHGLGAVLLLSDQGLAGIVTDGDLRRAVERHGGGVLGLRAADIATRSPITVRAATPLGAALRLMEDRPSQIAVLPVLDEHDRVVGLVRIHDLVQAGLG